MLQIRIHGRGGQGVVTAAELLSMAAFADGKYVQAFPSFGSERTGAPVMAFCRIDQKPIRSREPVTNPDVLIIQDPTLLHQVDLFGGLAPSAFVLINSSQAVKDLGIGDLLSALPNIRVLAFPASDIGLKHLGRPLANAPLLGGFAALTGQISLPAVQSAMRQKFSGSTGEANASASAEAYEYVASTLGRAQGVTPHAATS